MKIYLNFSLASVAAIIFSNENLMHIIALAILAKHLCTRFMQCVIVAFATEQFIFTLDITNIWSFQFMKNGYVNNIILNTTRAETKTISLKLFIE